MEEKRIDTNPDRRLTQLSRRTSGLTTLLEQRQELEGLSPAGEMLVAAVRWSA